MVEAESHIAYNEPKAWMRSEKGVARIVNMADMLYDESKVRDMLGLERKARFSEGFIFRSKCSSGMEGMRQ